MDFTIPAEHKLVAQTVRRFVWDELVPLEAVVQDQGELPEEKVKELANQVRALGLWMPHLPEEYGGGGIDTLGMCLLLEETNQTIASGDEVFGIDQPLTPLYHCTPEQKAKYLYPCIRGEKLSAFALSEPNAGSDPGGMMETTAVRDGDNWVINGSKTWISRMMVADFAIVFTVTDKQKRGRGGITTFLIDRDTPGFEIVRQIPTMGENGRRGPTDLVFRDCVVPDSQRLGPVGEGFRIAQGRLGPQRAYIGARCIGMATRCHQMAIAYSKQRVTFGQPLANRQAVQWMIADAAVDIHATRLMTHHCAWKFDQGEDVRQEASIVKLFATEMATRVIDNALQIHGGIGYTKDLPIEWFYRRVRGTRIYEGASEIHRWVIARNLLRD